ncbi:hypothetical protein A1Q1_02379 [Trichosporon asahii var. asahii CBS 2479]|uniref:Uncharacterized protein n=1 Tax=Trichosporon asahii var. asahii (strain ATCC 90039 / CBS 2479 / JCM 2466 / KCTC 7840 / NBRC 103889/ NCYC 2677 / UAMH 7654) TaxID=1186058 RepID=J6F0I4_TRIAS|nr:hypothetical protein A1Q1_02379 [Trichosporon asahii var. asahii CBS 2479]EJT48652.1 hypothetical protein A1Q1_02379 [Trichosporon asahii var. asahii CBS 2479]
MWDTCYRAAERVSADTAAKTGSEASQASHAAHAGASGVRGAALRLPRVAYHTMPKARHASGVPFRVSTSMDTSELVVDLESNSSSQTLTTAGLNWGAKKVSSQVIECYDLRAFIRSTDWLSSIPGWAAMSNVENRNMPSTQR